MNKWNQRLELNDSLYYSIQASQLAHGCGSGSPSPISRAPNTVH